MLATAFIAVTRSYLAAASSRSRTEVVSDDPSSLLDRALYQVVRDTENSASAIRFHSLLADMYGNDGFVGTAQSTIGEQGRYLMEDALPNHHLQWPFYYAGSVATPLSGRARGRSLRVIESSAIDLSITLSNGPTVSNQWLVINGPVFNGTGTGFDPATGNLDQLNYDGLPVALLPHFKYSQSGKGIAPNVGGEDESWDAVDCQNMFLSMLPPNAVSSSDIIPSFHRPHLLNYWVSRLNSQFDGRPPRELLKRVVSGATLRPTHLRHPGFTGSNGAFLTGEDPMGVLMEGPWDVDNDSDGIPDSVWLDLGLPIQKATDGRGYRPLFAILCVDLDGRLNLNAHGHEMSATSTLRSRGDIAGLATGMAVTLPRGSGYGPAEIDLGVIGEESRNLIRARYGVDGRPGQHGFTNLGQASGLPMRNNHQQHAQGHDPWGQNVVLLDHTGHPLTDVYGHASPIVGDGPYEVNLFQPQSSDSLFSVFELEKILRPHDIDSNQLPERLSQLAPRSLLDGPQAPKLRRLLTTTSFDVPVPSFQLSPAIRNRYYADAPYSPRIVDLATSRLQHRFDPDELERQLRHMFPQEVLHGRKLNLRDSRGATDQSPMTVNQRFARHLYCLMTWLMDPDFVNPRSPERSQAGARDDTARRIAQWAINCAEFRDSDGAMTPFEFDVNPRNGWQVDIDGDPRTVERGERRVVWGLEYPDLLLTETLAFHDRRVKDTDLAGQEDERRREMSDDDQKYRVGDDDLDQYRIPQGSLFFELYCPRARFRNNPWMPRDLYAVDSDRKRAALDLGRLAPSDLHGVQFPIWRVIITRWHTTRPDGAEVRASDLPRLRLDAQNSTIPMHSDGSTLLAERIVWFVRPHDHMMDAGDTTIYFNRGERPLIEPGTYAVVGPRLSTHIGWNSERDEPSRQLFRLAERFSYTDSTGASSSNVLGPPASAVIVAANAPAQWTNRSAPIGVSVSEPLPSLDYYPEPNPGSDERRPVDTYDDPTHPLKAFPDEPLDAKSSRPLGGDGLLETGTSLYYRTAFLQRLANPSRPWNPPPFLANGVVNPRHNGQLHVNPYVIVDWLPVDLTVFNGEDAAPDDWDENNPHGIGPFDPEDPAGTNLAKREKNHRSIRFASRQRYAGIGNNLWERNLYLGPESEVLDSSDYVPIRAEHTLGRLNQGAPAPLDKVPLRQYRGAPSTPFPWLTWNDHAYSNRFELLLVPASSASHLFEDAALIPANPFRADDPNAIQGAPFRAPFGFLMNFFHSSTQVNRGANYFRLLEFVEVPSPFHGTNRGNDRNHLDLTDSSSWRTPGRININTIYDERIWKALVHEYYAQQIPWSNVVTSRRGYEGPKMNSEFPTQFANPFRAPGSAHIRPPIPQLREQAEVQATLLRSRSRSRDESSPLFGVPLPSGRFHANATRNAYFRYQPLQRLANLVTTRSNVFAIWITVGFFEFDVSKGTLGAELGSTTGDVRRHRAFYIVDRSIPVAFQRGKNHNVDQAILLRRFIE